MNSNKELKVIISCSGKFHAFALAEQLEKYGILSQLYSSYSSIKNPLAKYLVSRRDKENIPKTKITTILPIAFGLKIYENPFFWNDLFDRWVAWKIRRSDATVFIGWSGMSLHSLRAAKKKGMITILERGSSHIIHQLKILKEEFELNNKVFPYNEHIEKKECQEYQEIDFISIPSTFVEKTFLDEGIKKEKLILNNYGVSNFFTNECEEDSKTFYVLYLGKISFQKGVIYLIEAINKLQESGREIKGLFVGGMDDSMKPIIENVNKEHIEFLGHKTHYELSKYISKASVAVVPSIQDGFAMVVPQILSCNVPVIVTENTGALDIIEEGKNGFIVPIRDANAIAEKIQLLFDNPAKLSELKEFILKNPIDLSWDAYGERYVKILEIILTS